MGMFILDNKKPLSGFFVFAVTVLEQVFRLDAASLPAALLPVVALLAVLLLPAAVL